MHVLAEGLVAELMFVSGSVQLSCAVKCVHVVAEVEELYGKLSCAVL